jgi:NitT/TauT family transport system permease protein
MTEISVPGAASSRATLKRSAFASAMGARLLSVVVVLAAWEVLAGHVYPSVLIPPLSKVLVTGFDLTRSGELPQHIFASMGRILSGFVIGSIVAAPLGLVMGMSRLVRSAVDPFIQFLRFVPAIAWLTPAVIWFGIGEMSKVAVIIYATVFVVAINTMVGVSNVSANKIWAAHMLGANRMQIFWRVMLPASLPFILTGMRLAMGGSFAAVVSAEMVSSNEGLGFLIFNSRLWMATDAIFVAILARA